jgi:hypothetical protein
MQDTEIWKDIPGYGNRYQASNLGRIKNVSTGNVLKGELTRGYRRHEFWDLKTKKAKREFAHKLILLAFVNNYENKPCCNHKNGIRDDNRIVNLEWCTHQENIIHACRSGLSKIGSQRGWSKITEADAIEIVRLYRTGMKQKDIKKLYPLAQSGICKIINGRKWTHATKIGDGK